jgi:transposase
VNKYPLKGYYKLLTDTVMLIKLMRYLLMYHEVHRLQREGLKPAQIARELVTDRRTIKKYLTMSEEEFMDLKHGQLKRRKVLDQYQEFVKTRLERFPDASAAQVHDWLKEHFNEMIPVSEKTVFNFVLTVRNRHGIPRPFNCRDYIQVAELPYGKQAQADFGEYNMTTEDGKRKKIYFFSIVLSRSRQKYVWFREHPFNTLSAIDAHERSFQHFMGIPHELVYDQDKLMLVDENKGDLVLTEQFRQYTQYRKFKLHFCRKADPPSKGKIENVIKYIKYNFLRGRTYVDIDTLNGEGNAWLSRTANAKTHAATKKVPEQEWWTEKEHLMPYDYNPYVQQSLKTYTVRKDNTISFKSNFYLLPSGTYQGGETRVQIDLTEDNSIIIYNADKNEIARHKVFSGKGKLIGNRNFKRDFSSGIEELLNEVSSSFKDPEMAINYLQQVRSENPRYIRDQLLLVRKMIQSNDMAIMNQALDICIHHKILRATDMESVVTKLKSQISNNPPPESVIIKTMNKESFRIIPQKSNISDYSNLMN